MREKQYKAFCDIKLTPTEWEQILDIRILDPDGWRGGDKFDFSSAIGLREFLRRASKSTTQTGGAYSDFSDALAYLSKEQDVK